MKDRTLQGGVAKIPLGRYVLAVSGGVDSIVLLDLLAKQAKSPKLRVPSSDKKAPSSQLPVRSYKFVVAHFNHSIRLDSGEDEKLVADAAGKYGLRFKVGQGRLGPGTSEDQARTARYKFLETVRKSCQAKTIITAHHQDDVMETAILNLLRGSGRRGLTAIIQNPPPPHTTPARRRRAGDKKKKKKKNPKKKNPPRGAPPPPPPFLIWAGFWM